MASIVLTNCRLIDGTGAPAQDGVDIVIEDRRISAVGPGAGNGIASRVTLDLQGWSVTPGLMNMHVHLGLKLPFPERKVDVERAGELALRCARKAIDALAAGVTTIRSPGDAKESAIDVRDAVNSGILPGPRIFPAGSAIIATGGHGYNSVGCIEADGPYEFRRYAREQLKLGASLIKVCITGGIGTPGEGVDTSQVTPDELAAAVDIAHKAGAHLCVHAGGSEPIRMAVEVGVDCIEHGYVFDDSVAQLMAERGTYLVPTLCVTHGLDYMIRHGCLPWMLEKTRMAQRAHVASIREAYRQGVTICNGTDLLPTDEIAGTIATVHEAELMVESIGMTPVEAIAASTGNCAKLLGLDGEFGTVAPGLLADLVAMPGDPSVDIRQLRGIGLVIKDGRVIRSDIPGCLVSGPQLS